VVPLNLASISLALAVHVLEPLGATLAVHVLQKEKREGTKKTREEKKGGAEEMF
jgi:hypothetical protein